MFRKHLSSSRSQKQALSLSSWAQPQNVKWQRNTVQELHFLKQSIKKITFTFGFLRGASLNFTLISVCV